MGSIIGPRQVQMWSRRDLLFQPGQLEAIILFSPLIPIPCLGNTVQCLEGYLMAQAVTSHSLRQQIRFCKSIVPRSIRCSNGNPRVKLLARTSVPQSLRPNISTSSRKFHPSARSMAAASDRDVLPDAYAFSPSWKDILNVVQGKTGQLQHFLL